MIDSPTDQEKSVLLAKVIGYKKWLVERPFKYSPGNPFWLSHIVNLYAPANMALAKKAIIWGHDNVPKFQEFLGKYALLILLDESGFGDTLNKLVYLLDELEKEQ